MFNWLFGRDENKYTLYVPPEIRHYFKEMSNYYNIKTIDIFRHALALFHTIHSHRKNGAELYFIKKDKDGNIIEETHLDFGEHLKTKTFELKLIKKDD